MSLVLTEAEKILHIKAEPGSLMALFFSDENLRYLDQTIIRKTFQEKGITISSQDISIYNRVMIDKYQLFMQGSFRRDFPAGSEQSSDVGLKTSLIALNRATVGEILKNVLSGVSYELMYQRKVNDFLNGVLPTPGARPVDQNIKGHRVLKLPAPGLYREFNGTPLHP